MVVVRGWGNAEMVVKGDEIPVMQNECSGDLIYSVVTIVNNPVPCT